MQQRASVLLLLLEVCYFLNRNSVLHIVHEAYCGCILCSYKVKFVLTPHTRRECNMGKSSGHYEMRLTQMCIPYRYNTSRVQQYVCYILLICSKMYTVCIQLESNVTYNVLLQRLVYFTKTYTAEHNGRV